MTSRLFAALEIPGKITGKLIDLRNQIYGNGHERVRWEQQQKLHLTLKFLGDVENDKIIEIQDSLKDSLGKREKFQTSFTGFDLFYRNGTPAILWAGLDNNEGLVNLHYEVEKSLYNLGFEKERRRFKPHITLLRIRGNEDFRKIHNFKNRIIPDFEFEADKVVLYKSKLLKSGSVYESLDSYKLK